MEVFNCVERSRIFAEVAITGWDAEPQLITLESSHIVDESLAASG